MADKKRSESFELVSKRLAKGQPVPMDAIQGVPEIHRAQVRMDQQPLTDAYAIERADIRETAMDAILDLGAYSGKDAEGHAVYAGAVKQGREYHLMFGLPASEKSTIADKLSSASHSRIMDSDYAKEQIPEFDGGWDANAVHNESKVVLEMATEQAMITGDNLVVPKIGSPPDKMIDLLKDAKAEGYKCYVHLVDLDPNKAMGRMLERFMSTGRYVPPEIAAKEIGVNGENKVMQSFETVVNSGICDGWTLWSNDVPMGDKPVLLGYSENPDESIKNLIAGADMDRSRLIGKTPETRDEALSAMQEIYDANDAAEADQIKRAINLRKTTRESSIRYTARQQNGTMMDRLWQLQRDAEERDQDGLSGPDEIIK